MVPDSFKGGFFVFRWFRMLPSGPPECPSGVTAALSRLGKDSESLTAAEEVLTVEG